MDCLLDSWSGPHSPILLHLLDERVEGGRELLRDGLLLHGSRRMRSPRGAFN